MNWNVSLTNPHVATIVIETSRKKDWEQWGFLSADRHFDNPKSDHALQEKHLKQCAERNAFIIDVGDFFCAMQGKYDPRSCKKDVREEQRGGEAYLNSLVRSGVDFWGEYKHLLAVFGEGNHETAIKNRLEYDLTSALVEKLQDQGSPVVSCGYRGYVRLQFKAGVSVRNPINLYYSHGAGGGGEVTKGVIRTARRAVYLPDAHIVVGGHIHESWQIELPRTRLLQSGKEIADTQLHISIPTYKEEFFNARGGFHHEKERPPKPLGGWWLRFYWDRSDDLIKYEAIRAK